DHGRLHLLANGKQFVFGILIEDVVDHLYRVDLPGLDCKDSVPGLPAIQTNTNRIDETLAAKIVEFVEPAIVSQPAVVPGVKLHQVKTLEPRAFQTAMYKLLDVIERIIIPERRVSAGRPLPAFRWNFCGRVEFLLAARAHDLPQ